MKIKYRELNLNIDREQRRQNEFQDDKGFKPGLQFMYPF